MTETDAQEASPPLRSATGGAGSLPVTLFLLLAALGCLRVPFVLTKRAKIDRMYEDCRKSFPDVPDISVEDLIAMLRNNKVVLVDVREPAEQEVSIIPNAILLDDFEQNIDAYQDRTIIPYCTIGYRSGLYAKKLQEAGFRVFNLRGGVLSWAHAGQVFANNGKETRWVHVYGTEWDLLPDEYAAVW